MGSPTTKRTRRLRQKAVRAVTLGEEYNPLDKYTVHRRIALAYCIEVPHVANVFLERKTGSTSHSRTFRRGSDVQLMSDLQACA